MAEPFGAQPDSRKADGVADAINRLLQNLVLKCAKAEGIRDFFHVGMVRYGSRVQSAFGGPLAGETLVPVSQLAGNPLRVEDRARMVDDRAGGLVEQKFKFPVWFESHPAGKTPMCEGAGPGRDVPQGLPRETSGLLPAARHQHHRRESDGRRPAGACEGKRALASRDGNVLVFNAHVSEKHDRPVEFPEDDDRACRDHFAKLLFRMSSTLAAQAG